MGSNCHDHEHSKIPGYWHSMDKNPGTYSGDKFTAGKLSISTPPFKNQLDSIRSRIMQGATNVELGFIGTGKGTAQNLTPGTLGVPERQAIKEIAKINDVGISSVHTAMSVEGLAGYSQNQFNENKRISDIEEVKRTIDFASDVTDGGAIVVHTGEFPYSIKREHGKEPFKTKEGKEIKIEEPHGNIEENWPVLFVDQYDGNISAAIRPTFKSFIYDGDDRKQIDITYFEERAKKNLENKDPQHIKEYSQYIGRNPTDEEYSKTFENKYWLANKHLIDTSSYEEKARFVSHKSSVNELKNNINSLTEDVEARIKIREKIPENKFIPHDVSKVKIDEQNLKIEKMKERLEIEKLHLKNYDLSIAEKNKKMFNLITIDEYGKKKTSESISELAMHAKKMTKDKKLKNPLFVAPENLWDGKYGAHPEDLRNIIKDARKQFIKDAVSKDKLSKRDAEKAAKDHIKATFDIGHANIWRKYFGGSENEFKQWLGSEINKLTKEGIIGHVHVSDNFGYNDEHLPPGYGNAPIKEFMTHLEKGKYEGEIIIEPGHHDYIAYTQGMAHLGTPIYRLHNQSSTWTDVQGSYFGRTHIPGYITPDYLPSAGGARQPFTWSELPLE